MKRHDGVQPVVLAAQQGGGLQAIEVFAQPRNLGLQLLVNLLTLAR